MKSILLLIALSMSFVSAAKEVSFDGQQCSASDKNNLKCMVCEIYCGNYIEEKGLQLAQDTEIGRVILNRVQHGLGKNACDVVHSNKTPPTCKLPKRGNRYYGSLLNAVQGAQDAIQKGPSEYCAYAKLPKDPRHNMYMEPCPEPTKATLQRGSGPFGTTLPSDASPGAGDQDKKPE